MEANEARVNVTYNGGNGDLPDAMLFDTSDAQVKEMVAEALQHGGVPGITVNGNGNVSLTDFVVDRFAATEVRPYNLIQLRPKTPFGG